MVKVSRVLHAGYLFESEETKILFDPLFESPFSINCHSFPAVSFNHQEIKSLKFDAIFISHFHDDHFSMESLIHLDRETPIFMFCVYPELLQLLEALGFKTVHSLQLNERVTVQDFVITPRRALDADVDSLFQIQVAGLNILNVVDSWIDEETLLLLINEKPWDLIMWPFQTMREMEVISPSRYQNADPQIPAEWKEQLSLLQPQFLVPSSCQFKMEPWSWHNQVFFPISYHMFAKEMSQSLPGTQIVRMNPGTSWDLTSHTISDSGRLPWVLAEGPQDVDYEFDKTAKAPSMQEIAQHFEVSEHQCTEVLRQCQLELVQRYNEQLDQVHDYFLKDGTWHLSLYAKDKTRRDLFFELRAGVMALVEAPRVPTLWRTEVCISKVYGALFNGESLSSLYIRVNDETLGETCEKALADADVVEDPLIRFLYTGKLGSYQIAQLKKLGICSDTTF